MCSVSQDFSTYQDIPERESMMKEFEECKTVADAEEIINSYFPNWLVSTMEKYCTDYPHFTKNWITLCNAMKIKPSRIILVSTIVFDEYHQQLASACEFMTKKGYVIRRVGELISCSVCKKAIPSYEVYEKLKEKRFPIPREWSDKCSGC